jgi:hypothetical protein
MHLVREWNWKAALFSAALRAPIFFISDHHADAEHATLAMLTEAVFAAGLGGFLGSFIQRLRDARPRWATALVMLMVIPAFLIAAQYVVHTWVSPQKIRGSLIASFLLAALSTGFNWFAMEQGAILTDGQADTLGHDLQHIPLIIYRFLMAGPRALGLVEKRKMLHSDVRPIDSE